MIKAYLNRFLLVCAFGLVLAVAVLLFVHYWPAQGETEAKPANTLVAEKRKFVLITRNDLQGYYNYEDQPQGFEYELANLFAEQTGMELQIVAGSGWQDIQSALLNNRADIIAGIVTSIPGHERFAFSQSYMTARQVPVYNKKQPPINCAADLDGRTVAVASGSAYQTRLDALMSDGLICNAVYYQDKTADDFVKGVSEGLYDVTMVYDYLALAYTRHYPNIAIGAVVKDDLELAWAVRPEDTALLAKINVFFSEMQADGSLERLYDRYFGLNSDQSYNELESFHRRIKRSLPNYHNTILQTAYQYGFDWRLIAAVIYQESQFNPNAVSYYGAAGLMQIMPKTAASLGLPAENIYDPHKNIAVGVRYLKRMYDLFENAEDQERIKLALAAYNVGIGHVLDARKLAADRGLDKEQWDNVGEMLLLLSQKEHYAAARYGYCNGRETNNYVNNITTFYDILRYQGANFNVGFALEDDFSGDYHAPFLLPSSTSTGGRLGRLVEQLMNI